MVKIVVWLPIGPDDECEEVFRASFLNDDQNVGVSVSVVITRNNGNNLAIRNLAILQ